METFYKNYKDKAAIFVVYIREAHPTDGWKTKSNEKDGIKIAQPKTFFERFEVANTCVESLKISIPCLLDDMKGTAQAAYAGWPDRHYVIDIEGKIAVKGAPGPKGFSVDQAEAGLKAVLANEGKMTDAQKNAKEPPASNRRRRPRR